MLISLKRYLDAPGTAPTVAPQRTAEASPAPSPSEAPSLVEAYRSALSAFALSASRACQSASTDLPRTLTGLGLTMSQAREDATVRSVDAQVVGTLQDWGERAHAYQQQRAAEARELLVAMARAGTAMAGHDAEHARRFRDLTTTLQKIATLDDLETVRASVSRSAADLGACIEQMSHAARASVAQLQAEVVRYQAKLEEAEQLAVKDPLTGLFNRSRLEPQLEERIRAASRFCVALIDLDGFKAVNDRFGHAAGDDLLKQFAAELRANARPRDFVCRFGGDEFVVVLEGSKADALAHVARIEKWVVGAYTLTVNGTPKRVDVNASVGVAEWTPGHSAQSVLDAADAEMYRDKATRGASR